MFGLLRHPVTKMEKWLLYDWDGGALRQRSHATIHLSTTRNVERRLIVCVSWSVLLSMNIRFMITHGEVTEHIVLFVCRIATLLNQAL